MTTKSRIALAALAAALATPALAGEPCAVCDDPTWPVMATPSPSTTVRGDASTAAILSDPTAPEMAYAMPSVSLVGHDADGPIYTPAIGEEPAVHYALVPGVPQTVVAAAR